MVFFIAYLYTAGTQHENLHPAGWPIYSAGLYMNHVLATANTGEIWRGFGKNAGEENDRERGRDEWDERGGVVLN